MQSSALFIPREPPSASGVCFWQLFSEHQAPPGLLADVGAWFRFDLLRFAACAGSAAQQTRHYRNISKHTCH